MDVDFMKRATKVTSFNLMTSDFQTTKYKLEIQSLYHQHMFPSFKPEMALSNFTKDNYNKLIRLLKADDKMQYFKLHRLELSGVGPAEAVLFLLTKQGVVAGGSSAGVDIIVGTTKYEVKAAKWKSTVKKDYVSDFKLGGNIPGMTQFESKLQQIFYDLKITTSPGAPEIAGSLFERLERQYPIVYKEQQKKYQQLAMNYFGSHEVIFVQNGETQSDFGEIMAINNVKAEDIKMERYTSRTIKPLIKI